MTDAAEDANVLKLQGLFLEVIDDAEGHVRAALDIIHEAAHDEEWSVVLCGMYDIGAGMDLLQNVLATMLATIPPWRMAPTRYLVREATPVYKAQLAGRYKTDPEVLRRVNEIMEEMLRGE